jgi:outer membrane protein OmpA-like peptidoglycan-associated protein
MSFLSSVSNRDSGCDPDMMTAAFCIRESTANEAATAAGAAQSSAYIRPRMRQTRLPRRPKLLPLLDWRTRLRSDGAVDRRVSELDDYKIESENDVFFGRDSAVLKDEGKPALADLAKLAKSLQGYLIEISGYASNALGSKTDQEPHEQSTRLRLMSEAAVTSCRKLCRPAIARGP